MQPDADALEFVLGGVEHVRLDTLPIPLSVLDVLLQRAHVGVELLEVGGIEMGGVFVDLLAEPVKHEA